MIKSHLPLNAILLVSLTFAGTGCGPLTTGVHRYNSWEGNDSPITGELKKILDVGGTASLAVIGSVDTDFSKESFEKQGTDIETWKKEMYEAELTDIEQEYDRTFKPYGKFRITDRASTEQLAKKIGFSQTGSIDQASRNEIGAKLGATLIFIFHMKRTTMTPLIGKYGVRDIYSMSLISVETGGVLASQTVTVDL